VDVTEAVTLHEVKRIGQRTWVRAWQIKHGDIQWYYMPWYVWQDRGPFKGWEI
jgi:hypothetical protein